MKLRLLKKISITILFIILGVILAVLCLFNIAHGPKNLSQKVKLSNISYIQIHEPGWYTITTDDPQDIKTFKKIVRDAMYYQSYGDYKWDYHIYIEVYYNDGSVIGLGPHRIQIGEEKIWMYDTSFDFRTMYNICRSKQ